MNKFLYGFNKAFRHLGYILAGMGIGTGMGEFAAGDTLMGAIAFGVVFFLLLTLYKTENKKKGVREDA